MSWGHSAVIGGSRHRPHFSYHLLVLAYCTQFTDAPQVPSSLSAQRLRPPIDSIYPAEPPNLHALCSLLLSLHYLHPTISKSRASPL
ncbi:hypothetical protein C8F01DRAFT_1265370 [Mycena amicta]|nr:hypothetical protein C8F01DRAFT_1265370 [Mycena amicta]